MLDRRLGQLGAIVVVALFVAMASVLLLSDRAPVAVDILGDAVVDAGRRVEAEFDVDLLDRDDIPGRRDEIGHALLWGTGMFVIGYAARRRVPVTITAIILAGVSLLSEYGQEVLSSSRVAQASDAVANVVGIVIAAVVLGLGLALWRLVAGRNRLATDETMAVPAGDVAPAGGAVHSAGRAAPTHAIVPTEPADGYHYRYDAERLLPDAPDPVPLDGELADAGGPLLRKPLPAPTITARDDLAATDGVDHEPTGELPNTFAAHTDS